MSFPPKTLSPASDDAWESKVPGPLHPHIDGDSDEDNDEFGPEENCFTIMMDYMCLQGLLWLEKI